MEAVTRREQALHLFHLLGKVLYNKRPSPSIYITNQSQLSLLHSGKGDPPGSSATLKDKAREAELDAQLKEPSELPFWLSEHKRRPSRLSADVRPHPASSFLNLLIGVIELVCGLTYRYGPLRTVYPSELYAVLRRPGSDRRSM